MMGPSWIQFTYPSAQKNTGYCCAWSILRKSSETGFPLIGGWSLNPIMIFLELPYESSCPLCRPLHLTVKLPAHWKLNLPSFKTEAPFQEMIFTRKFRLQKLALISVFHFFLSAILLHHNQLLGIIDGTQAHSPSGQSLQFYQSSSKRWWGLETLGCYVLWSYKQMQQDIIVLDS